MLGSLSLPKQPIIEKHKDGERRTDYSYGMKSKYCIKREHKREFAAALNYLIVL